MHMINNVFSQSYHIRVSHMWDICVCLCVCVVYRSDVFRRVITMEEIWCRAGKKMNKCIKCKQL